MAPKAGGRTSARSGTSRVQASSPPNQSRNRELELPIGRRTRSTRSQSVESREQNTGIRKTKRGARSTSREGSADSVGSNNSIASSRGGRTRQATRAAAIPRDLSMVAEDREAEQSEEEEDDQSPRLRSPGAASQLSGTTAVTSHSQSQIAEIDPKIAKHLPDLLQLSEHILNLLAPADVTEDVVRKIMKELMAPGSERAIKLKDLEELLKTTRDNFGTDDYVNRSYVLRKLFGSDEPGDGAFRPDAILYAANLATLVKNFLVAQKKSSKTFLALQRLDRWFPEAIVRDFDENIQYGGSNLLDQSFAVGLDIRTQYVITDLELKKDSDRFDPEYILAIGFYTLPEQRSLPVDFFEDTTTNARPKDILQGGSSNSEAQVMLIHDRVNEIRAFFRQSEEAIEAGDVVDFDQLEELFPWSTFLSNLVIWARSRYEEISENILEQGGLNEIMKDLEDVMADIDSQSQVGLEHAAPDPKPRKLQPSAPIVQSGTSLNTPEGALGLQIVKMRTGASSSAPKMPTSSFPQQPTASARPSGSRTMQDSRKNENPAHPPSDGFRPDFDDGGGEEMAGATFGRPASEYAARWQANTNEKNKENLGIPKPKRSLFDSQPGAQSATWNSQKSTPEGPSKRRRPQQEQDEEEEEEEESVDGGFEEDRRIPDVNRRANAPSSRRLSPVPEGPGPSKRVRTHREGSEPAGGRGAARQRQERAESAQSSNVRRAVVHAARPTGSQRVQASDDESGERAASSGRRTNAVQLARVRSVAVDESEEEYLAPTATQVAAIAREETARRKIVNAEPNKKRTPWSENDSNLLVDCIEEFGCSWSTISKLDGWEHARDQVALKDKARNLKVNWLKSGVPLPHNFDCVRLGKKEIDAVRRVDPDYEPER